MKFPLVIHLLLFTVWQSLPVSAQTEPDLTPANEAYFKIQPYFAGPASNQEAVLHLGIETTLSDNAFVISALLNGFPGEQANLRRGDKIISVNGIPFNNVLPFGTSDLNTADSSLPLLALELERNGQRLNVEARAVYENMYDSRRSASLASVQEFSAGNKTIAYFHLWSLSRNYNDLHSFLQVMDKLAGTDGLILDLRDSYGFLSIHHIDAFLPSRQRLISVTGQGNVHTRIGASEPPLQPDYYGRPIAILINGETAGGAELLAFQLASLDRVTIVGMPSAGKLGSYQPASDSERKTLTYQPLTDTEIDGIAAATIRVEPELEIPYSLATNTLSDPQFAAAFNVLLGNL